MVNVVQQEGYEGGGKWDQIYILGISLWPNLGKAGVGLRPERCQEGLSWVERRDGQSQEDSMGCGGR